MLLVCGLLAPARIPAGGSDAVRELQLGWRDSGPPRLVEALPHCQRARGGIRLEVTDHLTKPRLLVGAGPRVAQGGEIHPRVQAPCRRLAIPLDRLRNLVLPPRARRRADLEKV